jgi:UTP--glucose-1-phosphate uridylyltransferase
VIAAMEVEPADISLYGCITPETFGERVSRVIRIVEKPPVAKAASNLAAIGRYVFTPEIFDAIERTEPGHGGEIQLTDAINLMAQERPVFALSFDRGRFDVGNKLDYLKATVTFALEREDVGPGFRAWLRELMKREGLG